MLELLNRLTFLGPTVCIFVSTATVQTPLDILFVSGPPLSQPKQVVPHEADCGAERINATICVCKCIHVPVQACMSTRGYVYIINSYVKETTRTLKKKNPGNDVKVTREHCSTSPHYVDIHSKM